jgi:hypothetical protein
VFLGILHKGTHLSEFQGFLAGHGTRGAENIVTNIIRTADYQPA